MEFARTREPGTPPGEQCLEIARAAPYGSRYPFGYPIGRAAFISDLPYDELREVQLAAKRRECTAVIRADCLNQG